MAIFMDVFNKGKGRAYNVTAVELYCYAVGGINNASVWEIYVG